MSATCVLGRKRRHYQRHRHMQQRQQAAMFSSGGQRKLPKGCPRKKLDLKCHKEKEQKGCMEPKIDRDPPLGHLVTQARHQDDSPSCCIPHGDADGGCKEPKRAECDKKKKKKKKDTSCCAPPSAVSRLELLGPERGWSACLFPQQLTSGDCFNGGGSPVTVGDCGGVTARRMSLPPLMPSSAATCVLARKRGHYACNLQQKSWYSKGCKEDKKKRLKCIIKDKEAEKDIKPPCKEEPCCGEEMCAWSSSAAEVVTRGSLAAAGVTCGDCCSAVTCGDAPWRTACLPAMATCVLARKRRFYGYPQQKSWYSKGCKKDKKKRLKCIIKDKEAEKDIKPPCKEEPCCGKKPKKAKKPKKPKKKKKKKKKAKKCSSCGEESESEDECCKIPKPQKVKDECCSGGCPPPKDKCAPKKPKKPKKKKMKCRKLRPACSKKDDPPGKCCDKIEDPFGCCQSHDKAKELAKKKKDDCDF